MEVTENEFEFVSSVLLLPCAADSTLRNTWDEV